MTTQRFFCIAAIALLLVACGDQAAPEFASGDGMSMSIGFGYDGSARRAAEFVPAPALVPTTEKIIRSAVLSIQVREVATAIARIDTLMRTGGGIVAHRQQKIGENGKQTASLTLRVAADSLGNVMTVLRELGDVRRDDASQQDVSKEYFDLETRLAVKEQSLTRLRQLLANRTARLADVLEVEREITRLVTEIEQMKGERRYYDDRVVYATIELQLFEPGAGTHRSAFTVGKALRQSLEVLSTSLAWLVYLTIFVSPWLAIASVLWWVVRRVRRPVEDSGTTP